MSEQPGVPDTDVEPDQDAEATSTAPEEGRPQSQPAYDDSVDKPSG